MGETPSQLSRMRRAAVGLMGTALLAGTVAFSPVHASGMDTYVPVTREYQVEAYDWGFRLDEETPLTELKVYKGDLVRIVLTSEHDETGHEDAHTEEEEEPSHGLGGRIGGTT